MDELYLRQNEWLTWLAGFRTEGLNHFFRFLNFFDTNYFYFLLVPVIWVGFSWRWGSRIFFLLIIAGFLNYFFKNLFGQPRPFVYLPNIELIPLRSFGFPSGGAQSSLLLGGLVIHYWKGNKGLIVGLSYLVLISFSRIYLGVHYFTDLIGGWILGALLLYLFLRHGEKIENWLTKKSYLTLSLFSFSFPLFGIWLLPSAKVLFLMIGAMTVGLSGLLASYAKLHLKPTNKIGEGIKRGFVAVFGGLIVLLVVDYLIQDKTLRNLISPIFFSLWLTMGASILCLVLVPNTTRDVGKGERKRKIDRW